MSESNLIIDIWALHGQIEEMQRELKNCRLREQALQALCARAADALEQGHYTTALGQPRETLITELRKVAQRHE